jgi:hypothetical protein
MHLYIEGFGQTDGGLMANKDIKGRVWRLVEILTAKIDVDTKLNDADQADNIVSLATAIVATYEFNYGE